MGKIVTVGSTDLDVVEIGGERVVTLAMVDAVHQRPEGTAGRNFRENRSRFIDGEDYRELTADDIRRQSLEGVFPARTSKGIVLTESGYLMLVKSFTDDLAWSVQRQLVKAYFKAPAPPRELSRLELLQIGIEAEQGRLAAVQRADILEHRIEADAPKVAFAESVAVAPDAIAVSTAAKILNTGQKRLMAFMRQIGWVTRKNEPYQAKVDDGCLDVKISDWDHPKLGLQKTVTALITGKGLEKLHALLAARAAGIGRIATKRKKTESPGEASLI
jgi:phage antirepressor YoqD-like protein